MSGSTTQPRDLVVMLLLVHSNMATKLSSLLSLTQGTHFVIGCDYKLVELYKNGILNDSLGSDHCTMYMKGYDMLSEEITSVEIKAYLFS